MTIGRLWHACHEVEQKMQKLDDCVSGTVGSGLETHRHLAMRNETGGGSEEERKSHREGTRRRRGARQECVFQIRRRGDASAEHSRPEVTSDFAEVRTSRRSAGLVQWEIRRQRVAAECEDDRK